MPNNTERTKRCLKVGKQSALICFCGLGYAFLVRRTGIAIPCPFHWLTGLQCPGCGVTRMCMALLTGAWKAVWDANAMLLCLLPWLMVTAVAWIAHYIRMGERTVQRWQTVVIGSACVLLVLFGIARNLLAWFA